MPTIHVPRGAGRGDKLRGCKVLMDEQERGTIRRDETRSTTVADGAHQAKFRVDWCGSRVLAAACDGVDAALGCGPAWKGLLTVLHVLLWPRQRI